MDLALFSILEGSVDSGLIDGSYSASAEVISMTIIFSTGANGKAPSYFTKECHDVNHLIDRSISGTQTQWLSDANEPIAKNTYIVVVIWFRVLSRSPHSFKCKVQPGVFRGYSYSSNVGVLETRQG